MKLDMRLETNKENIKIKLKPIIPKIKKRINHKFNPKKEWIQDKVGYFLVKIFPKQKKIGVRFVTNDNIARIDFFGKSPEDIYIAVAKELPNMRKEHYAYLGKELEKAYLCLNLGIDYVQDAEIKLSRKSKK